MSEPRRRPQWELDVHRLLRFERMLMSGVTTMDAMEALVCRRTTVDEMLAYFRRNNMVIETDRAGRHYRVSGGMFVCNRSGENHE